MGSENYRLPLFKWKRDTADVLLRRFPYALLAGTFNNRNYPSFFLARCGCRSLRLQFLGPFASLSSRTPYSDCAQFCSEAHERLPSNRSSRHRHRRQAAAAGFAGVKSVKKQISGSCGPLKFDYRSAGTGFGAFSVQRVLIDNVIGNWAVKFLMRHTAAAEMIAPRSASLFSKHLVWSALPVRWQSFISCNTCGAARLAT